MVPCTLCNLRLQVSGVEKVAYLCLHCSKSFTEVEAVGVHIRVTEDKELSCKKKCPKGFKLTLKGQRTILGGSDKYLCAICAQEFLCKPSLYEHEYKVHGIRPKKMYTCNTCGYMSAKSWDVKRHERIRHTEGRPEICEICGKNFKDRGGVISHIATVHKEKKYKCRFCPQMLTRPSARLIHEKLHTGIKEHQCSFCNRYFASSYNLHVHERIHTGHKPYKCQLCGTSFAQRNSLDVHMKKHGVEKPAADKPAVKRGKTTIIPEVLATMGVHVDSRMKEQPVVDIEPIVTQQKHLRQPQHPNYQHVPQQHDKQEPQQLQQGQQQQLQEQFQQQQMQGQDKDALAHAPPGAIAAELAGMPHPYLYSGFRGIIFPGLPFR